ncbi:SDR family oxidoreductase [uncultured Oscillibacter sp.]|uniref:SDR family oxidoreductase n=1 Tax=uncultured Oscillibacter sp. TaxID=876091 RepID=UPI0025F70D03|nr:SDR family oxidoreductase [uncultured Oscillibacter sp.]
MKNLLDLTGKKALVTGGSRGIGNCLARGLHDAGAEVAIFYHHTCADGLVADMQGDGPAVHAIRCNVAERAELEAGVEAAARALGGRIDILINAAGINRRHWLEEFPAEEWEAVIATNLNSVVYCSQLVGRYMIRQGDGRIINLASMNSFVAGKRVGAYVASKGAIAQVTKAFANEWADKGIRVNAIAPGYIRTDMTTALQNDEAAYMNILNHIPAGRWGTPEDLVAPVLLLVSDAASYVNGIVMPIDGGYLVR